MNASRVESRPVVVIDNDNDNRDKGILSSSCFTDFLALKATPNPRLKP